MIQSQWKAFLAHTNPMDNHRVSTSGPVQTQCIHGSRASQLDQAFGSSNIPRLAKSEIKNAAQTVRDPKIAINKGRPLPLGRSSLACDGTISHAASAPNASGSSTRKTISFPSNSEFILPPSLVNSRAVVIVVLHHGE